MRYEAFSAIERILKENGLPVPKGHGNEKLDAISHIVATHDMPDEVRERLRNLLSLR